MRRTRLTHDEVATIKATLLHTNASQTQIAKYYDVRRQVVNNVVQGRSGLTIKPSDPIPEHELPLGANEAKRRAKPDHPDNAHKVEAVIDHWQAVLANEPDKLRAMLRKTVHGWDANKLERVYSRLAPNPED